jgi:hypothetical protein
MVFSNGVWYDPEDKLFKTWYMAKGGTAHAFWKDCRAWEEPELDVEKRGPTSCRPARAITR